jgi:hypothetical protein
MPADGGGWMTDPERRQAETSVDEMSAILATDLGLKPGDVVGWVIIAAAEGPEPDSILPVMRSNMCPQAQAFVVADVLAKLTAMVFEDHLASGHGDEG